MKAVDKLFNYVFRGDDEATEDKKTEKDDNFLLSVNSKEKSPSKYIVELGNKDIKTIDMDQTNFDKQAIDMVDPEVVRELSVLPFKYRNNELYVVISSKSELYKLEKLHSTISCEIRPFIGDKKSIQVLIDEYFPADNTSFENDNDTSISREKITKLTEDETEKYVGNIIFKGIKNNASDIHIENLNDNASIRYRVNGRLVYDPNESVVDFELLASKIKVKAELFTVESNVPQKGEATYITSDKVKINYTALLLPINDGEKILIKLPQKKIELQYDDLGLEKREKQSIEEMFEKKLGLIIVSGLPGNGRSTTIYGMLRKYSSRENSIISIEKNIYSKIKGVSQIEISSYSKNSNKLNLLDIVEEHDADIIAVDIDLDSEMMNKLVKIALSGKKVIATLHFPTIYDTLIGLTSMNIEPYILASVLEGVIAQSLVAKRCEKCISDDIEDFHKKKGVCKACRGTKYNGKASIFEVFKKDSEHWRYLLNISDFEKLKEKLSEEKSTFQKNSERLIKSGITTIQECVRVGIGKKYRK